MMRYFLVFVIALTMISCQKADQKVKSGKMELVFTNMAGNQKLNLGSSQYQNQGGEIFTVSTLKYFISNINLTKTTGEIVTIPQDSCYFLVDESSASSLKPTFSLPEGSYSKINFLIGVDSLRNTKDLSQRTGILDPTAAAADMYWSWNSGYIFFKIEGVSQSSPQTDKSFRYHIGLFGGYSSSTVNNLKIITLDLSTKGISNIISGKTSHIAINADILKIFNGASPISIANNSVVMATANSAQIANNYALMFSHASTVNE